VSCRGTGQAHVACRVACRHAHRMAAQ
jgi:hypothetical protein